MLGSHLPPPLAPRPGAVKQRPQTQLPDLLTNYSQSRIVDRFANDDDYFEADEDRAAMGKNAFMPQPMLGDNTLWILDQQNRMLMQQLPELGQRDQFSRQPDFESNQSPVVSSQNGASESGQTQFDSMANSQHRSTKDTSQTMIASDQWQNIIDWVNSFNDPSCLLVSNWCDFRDGIALCHLVAMIGCNEADQEQMNELVHHEHKNNPNKMVQNIELALNVLKASSVSLPDAIMRMQATDIQSSEVSCFIFLETLRQAKQLGIIKLLEEGSPIKGGQYVQELQMDDHEKQHVFQQSPMELESTQRLSNAIEDLYTDKTVHLVELQKSLHEVVEIETTLEQTTDMKSKEDSSLSPGFKAEKQSLRGKDLPLQMNASKTGKKKDIAKTEVSSMSLKDKRITKSTNQSRNQTPLARHTHESQHDSNQLHRSRSRTSHQQDSSYKPLFTENISQKKKLQELQLQIKNYDNVIKNSYDRLSTNQKTPSRGTPINSDLGNILKKEIYTLDRQIQFEQEVARQLPFLEQHSGNKNRSSSPRMQSPVVPHQHQRRQCQISEKADKREESNPVDEIDLIMQQMQTLNVEKNEVEIHPVDEKTKNKILKWLVEDVKLISNQVSTAKLLIDLPKYCRNGVLFGDLVNRLQGRDEVIKGLHRTPKNMTAISANFDKVLGYLKDFPRFSSRYLWAQSKAIEGNTDVIWGLLDDIWHWNFNKISLQDPARRQQLELRQSASQPTSFQAASAQITASSSQPRSKAWQGPPKMRDYLKNGEKAMTGLRASAENLDAIMPIKKISEEDKSQISKKHNFNPTQKENGVVQDEIQFLNQQKLSNDTNYHSFGQQPILNSVAQQPSQIQNKKSTAQLSPSRSTPKLSRPPKAPPQLTNLSNLSSLLAKPPQQLPQFEQVPHLNSARSLNTGNNRYSIIEQQSARKRSNSKHKQQQRSRQNSQFESPRSYSGFIQSNLQQQHTQQQAIQQRPPISARNNSSQAVPSQPQMSVASQRNSNSANRQQKLVHMRTSRDYQEIQQQSALSPLTQQTISQDKGISSFKSVNSTSSQQVLARFTPKNTNSDAIVDEWLTHLKFHPFMSAEFDYVSLREDPKRNGIFLAELISYLLPQSILARSLSEGSLINQKPGSVIECHQNWTNIFNVLNQLLTQYSRQHSARLLTKQVIDQLLQGDRLTLYKILYMLYLAFFNTQDESLSKVDNIRGSSMGCHSSLGGVTSSNGGASYLQQVGPLVAPVEIIRSKQRNSSNSNSSYLMQAIPTSDGSVSALDLELPYTPDELSHLDLSIVQWLKEIGQLKALSIDFEKVDSILDLQGVLRNGVLLCALVSKVFRTRIKGVFKDPKTETTCISNIRKALKILQTSRKMSQKFTWTEKQVYECRRSVILGLLEDIHRIFDGLPPRKRGQTYFDDGPYLGVRFQEQVLINNIDHFNQQSFSSQYH